MRIVRRRFIASALALFAFTLSGVARTASAQDSTTRAINERLDDLDQRIRVLSRLREIAADSIAALAKPAAAVANRDGFSLRSADGAFQLRLRGYLQTDARVFSSIGSTPATSTFFIRRARPILEGTLFNRYDFRIMPDFGQGTAVLFDAYSEIRLWPALAIRAGKFKPPVALERLQAATDLPFAERGLPTGLAPNRDVGFQLSGDLAGALVSYQVGLFDGTPDIGNSDGDVANSKDVVGRVFFQPLIRSDLASTIDLGVGVAGSSGTEPGTVAASAVSTYRSPGQLTVFRYRGDGTAPNTVVADGTRKRFAPQGYLNVGPVGLLGEYTTSTQRVRLVNATDDLTTKSWQVSGRWFLTGEKASFKSVTPKKIFDPDAKTWGAWELVARYGVLTPDADAFPVYANAANAIQEEKAWGVGINWHFARNTKLLVNYEHTNFTAGAATGDRDPEKFFVTRIQVAF
jgi:phosphate-selective porin OprO/OprP